MFPKTRANYRGCRGTKKKGTEVAPIGLGGRFPCAGGARRRESPQFQIGSGPRVDSWGGRGCVQTSWGVSGESNPIPIVFQSCDEEPEVKYRVSVDKKCRSRAVAGSSSRASATMRASRSRSATGVQRPVR